MSGRIAPAEVLRVLLPEPGQRIALADPDAAARIDGLYRAAAADWVRMNMIGTLDGGVVGSDGTSDSISNRVDRAILERIRAMSDAVLVGARTLRQERHTIVERADLVVVTLSGELAGHRIAEAEAHGRVHVLCPPEAVPAARRSLPGASVHEALPDRRGTIPAAEILGICAGLGLRRIVAEGGRGLVGRLLDDDAVDEICLSSAPVFGEPDGPRLPGSRLGRRFERAVLAVDETGVLYSRLFRSGVRN
ncbi:MAG: dihydrofolate reductase family protein [Pseudoclavibacter sp.]|nr:dihydrofolate reductase family protein [Pseudoclavibacter sp.]